MNWKAHLEGVIFWILSNTFTSPSMDQYDLKPNCLNERNNPNNVLMNNTLNFFKYKIYLLRKYSIRLVKK
jgi:hypothetical protein